MIIEDQKFTPYKDGLAVIPHKEETTSVSADEMFEKLKFKKVIDNKTEVKYEYRETIMEDKLIHTIQIAKVGKIVFSYRDDNNHQVMGIGKQELQAINEKCKELGWI